MSKLNERLSDYLDDWFYCTGVKVLGSRCVVKLAYAGDKKITHPYIMSAVSSLCRCQRAMAIEILRVEVEVPAVNVRKSVMAVSSEINKKWQSSLPQIELKFVY